MDKLVINPYFYENTFIRFIFISFDIFESVQIIDQNTWFKYEKQYAGIIAVFYNNHKNKDSRCKI